MLNSAIRAVLFVVGATLFLELLGAFRIGPIWVTPNKLATALLLVLVGIHWLASGRGLPRNPKNAWVLVFAAAMVLSTVFSLFQGTEPIRLLIRWTTFASLFLFYFLLIYLLQTRRDLDLFLWSLVVGGAVAGISMAGGLELIEFQEGGANIYGFDRSATGLASGMNQNAANLLLSAALALCFYFTSRSRLRKAFLLLMVGCMAGGIAVTLSRSGFLAALAMGGLWLFRFRRPENLRYVLIGLFVAAFAVLLAPETYVERLQTLGDIGAAGSATYRSDTHRIEMYKAGAEAVLHNPLLGMGLTRFKLWFVGSSMHNSFAEVLVDQGLIGLIPFLVIFVLTWRDLSRSLRGERSRAMRRDPELLQIRLRATFAQIGFVGTFVVIMFQPGAYWKGTWALFALSTAILRVYRARVLELRSSEVGEPPEPSVASFDLEPAAPSLGSVPR